MFPILHSFAFWSFSFVIFTNIYSVPVISKGPKAASGCDTAIEWLSFLHQRRVEKVLDRALVLVLLCCCGAQRSCNCSQWRVLTPWSCTLWSVVTWGFTFHVEVITSLSGSLRQRAKCMQDVHLLCSLFGALSVLLTISFSFLFF